MSLFFDLFQAFLGFLARNLIVSLFAIPVISIFRFSGTPCSAWRVNDCVLKDR